MKTTRTQKREKICEKKGKNILYIYLYKRKKYIFNFNYKSFTEMSK